MKLATLRSASPDGELVVVSRDLKKMTSAADIAPSLRVAFDDWARAKPLLEDRYRRLMDGLRNAMDFDETRCHSPLPRSFQWLDGTAYESHRYRMTKGRPAPEWFLKEPLSLMRWGLIPSWAKSLSGAARMINARSETAHTLPGP